MIEITTQVTDINQIRGLSYKANLANQMSGQTLTREEFLAQQISTFLTGWASEETEHATRQVRAMLSPEQVEGMRKMVGNTGTYGFDAPPAEPAPAPEPME